MRSYVKISFEQFKKDVCDDIKLYEAYSLPVRKTKNSAGYDFESLVDVTLNPGERKVLPTGIKCTFESDEMLMIFVRSSLGFKYNVRLCNQVGIIESDYYNNLSNEGHIMVAIQNEGTEDFVIKKHDRFAQGIFVKFLTVDNEEKIENTRTGGMGSTNEN